MNKSIKLSEAQAKCYEAIVLNRLCLLNLLPEPPIATENKFAVKNAFQKKVMHFLRLRTAIGQEWPNAEATALSTQYCCAIEAVIPAPECAMPILVPPPFICFYFVPPFHVVWKTTVNLTNAIMKISFI